MNDTTYETVGYVTEKLEKLARKTVEKEISNRRARRPINRQIIDLTGQLVMNAAEVVKKLESIDTNNISTAEIQILLDVCNLETIFKSCVDSFPKSAQKKAEQCIKPLREIEKRLKQTLLEKNISQSQTHGKEEINQQNLLKIANLQHREKQKNIQVGHLEVHIPQINILKSELQWGIEGRHFMETYVARAEILTFARAMTQAQTAMGGRVFVSGHKNKSNNLALFSKKFHDLIKNEFTLDSQSDEFYEQIVRFAHEASTPRGGSFNLFPANFGETKSAKAFYNTLTELNVDATLIAKIKEDCKAGSDYMNGLEQGETPALESN